MRPKKIAFAASTAVVITGLTVAACVALTKLVAPALVVSAQATRFLPITLTFAALSVVVVIRRKRHT